MKTNQPIVIDSGIPWPTLTIVGGTHGDEICGIEAIDILRDTLQIQKGKLFLLYGNLRAIEQWVRQTRYNLNRMYRDDATMTDDERSSYEYRRSREIMLYLDQSEAVLDLHSSPSDGSPVFIICEESGAEIVSTFPFSTRCYGFTELEAGGTDGYMNTRGKVGICVECGNHNDPTAREKALISIDRFLAYYGLIDSDESRNRAPQSVFRAAMSYKTQTPLFWVVKWFSDFEPITRWQLIGYDDTTPIVASWDGYILFARDRLGEIGVEGFMEIR